MSSRTIAGRYRVERAVGQGGMGTVWLCRDEVLGRDVAVKEVGHLPGESTPHLARALREARSSAGLNHVNVVSIFDAVEDGDQMWLVMEYVPGRALSEVIKADGRLLPQRVAWIGAQVADGLAAAHLQGTTHRDVKPGNILVTEGDHAKISDFGIARTMGDAQLTQSGMVIGTPGFFSPELARGGDPSPADDVWALGASLFAAVEGRGPFPETANAIAMLSRIASGRPARPEHGGPLTEVLGRMMDPDPVSRWSMADAAHALHRVHEQRETGGTRAQTVAFTPTTVLPDRAPDPAPQPTPVRAQARQRAPEPEPERRRPWGMVVLAGLATVAVLLALGAYLLDDPGDLPAADDETTSSPSGTTGAPTPDDTEPEEPTTEPSETPTPTPTPAPTATPSEEPTEDPPAGTRTGFVADYYGALPGDPASAWERLGPAVRAQVGGSYARYAGFWATIDAVTVTSTTASGANGVEVALTYTSANGVEDEVRLLTVTETGGGLLIVGDQVIG